MVYIGKTYMSLHQLGQNARMTVTYQPRLLSNSICANPETVTWFNTFEDEDVSLQRELLKSNQLVKSHENMRPRLWPIAGRLGNDCDAR
jgi:hypothetical protein